MRGCTGEGRGRKMKCGEFKEFKPGREDDCNNEKREELRIDISSMTSFEIHDGRLYGNISVNQAAVVARRMKAEILRSRNCGDCDKSGIECDGPGASDYEWRYCFRAKPSQVIEVGDLVRHKKTGALFIVTGRAFDRSVIGGIPGRAVESLTMMTILARYDVGQIVSGLNPANYRLVKKLADWVSVVDERERFAIRHKGDRKRPWLADPKWAEADLSEAKMFDTVDDAVSYLRETRLFPEKYLVVKVEGDCASWSAVGEYYG